MAIYLKHEAIKGNVTAEGYEKCIKVSSVHFGVGRPITMEAGKMANREVGKPTISEVSISKEADNSVAALFKEAVTGSAGKKVELFFVRTGTKKVEEFMNYTLYDCLISGYNVSCDGDEEPLENLTLSFSKCEILYKDHDASNKTGNPQRSGYDLTKATPL